MTTVKIVECPVCGTTNTVNDVNHFCKNCGCDLRNVKPIEEKEVDEEELNGDNS